MDIDYMAPRAFSAYWSDVVFPCRATASRALNEFQHFTMDVDGLRVHFIHERGEARRASTCADARLAGFVPGVREADSAAHASESLWRKCIRMQFDVVVPSLPGYGFSEAATAPGMNNRRIAQLWLQLMRALGYERFGAQGGDWGAGISTWLARDFPERIPVSI